MDTNFIFHRFLQLTGLCKKPDVVIRIFELGNVYQVTQNQIRRWSIINADKPNRQIMPDQVFSAFVRGLLSYIRIQQANDINVFDFEQEFINDVIAIFFDYRKEMSESGKEIFNFD
ncbi:hypothetical protein [uncultured Gilliamella sp.]|uniref:hypothetical protein n=1 Tax=uncultured Gilliamella sp. TaxID=1193505 RepID=UPI0025F66338|nr:hypothetical protein [uncultured Gilliamella sp.]